MPTGGARARKELRSLDAPGFAWEFLRRNPDFQQDRRKLERAARQGALNQAEVDAFARRWGVRFRKRRRDTRPNSVRWAVQALPTVVALTGVPVDLAGPASSFRRSLSVRGRG